MRCAKCGREAPEDAVYCPHCTGNRALSEREIINGGLKGGAIGLVLGLAVVTVLLAVYDLERGIKAIVLALPLGSFATGLILGLVRARRDWK